MARRFRHLSIAMWYEWRSECKDHQKVSCPSAGAFATLLTLSLQNAFFLKRCLNAIERNLPIAKPAVWNELSALVEQRPLRDATPALLLHHASTIMMRALLASGKILYAVSFSRQRLLAHLPTLFVPICNECRCGQALLSSLVA